MTSFAFDPEETTHWEQIQPRTVSPEKWKKFEANAAEMFQAFGMDLDTPGTLQTPTRFVRALYDATKTSSPVFSCSAANNSCCSP